MSETAKEDLVEFVTFGAIGVKVRGKKKRHTYFTLKGDHELDDKYPLVSLFSCAYEVYRHFLRCGWDSLAQRDMERARLVDLCFRVTSAGNEPVPGVCYVDSSDSEPGTACLRSLETPWPVTTNTSKVTCKACLARLREAKNSSKA